MKKILLGALIVSIIAGVAATSATSGTAASSAPVVERGYVSAYATSGKELTPDTAEISISVVTYDKNSLQKATDENKQTSEKVISALKGMINTADKDFVKTTNFRANQLYKYYSGKRTFDKHEVSNTIVIHTKSIDKVGNMIDKAISLGATEVSNLTFTVSKYDAECGEILATATQKARNQAEVMVKAAGSEIVGVKSLNGTCSTSGTQRVYRYAQNSLMMAKEAMSEDSAAGPSTPIEAGIVKIYANVDASFFVK